MRKPNLNEQATIGAELHYMQRMILFTFCGLICVKSRQQLQHWAMCEPLGFHYKGLQQPSRKSLSGGFTSTMQTCWKRLDKIRDECMPLFNDILQSKPTVHVALDNHNQMHRQKDQSYGKLAVSHIGTAYYAR